MRIFNACSIFNPLFQALQSLHVATGVLRIGPMRSPNPPLKCILLLDQILLASICNRHVTSVDAESWSFTLRAEIIVGCSTIPEEEVTRLCAHLDPLAPFVGEPLHTGSREAIPLVCPLVNAIWFVGEFPVELFGEEMSAFANDETTVIGTVG